MCRLGHTSAKEAGRLLISAVFAAAVRARGFLGISLVAAAMECDAGYNQLPEIILGVRSADGIKVVGSPPRFDDSPVH